MKRIFSTLVAVIAIMFAVSARAQFAPIGTFQAINAPTNGTSLVPTNTFLTLTNSILLDCSGQRWFAVDFIVAGGTATSNMNYWLAPTCDGITWDSNNVKAIAIAETGTAGGTNYSTNWDTGGYLGYFIVAVSNNSTSATGTVTNTIKYTIKHGYP